MNRRTFLLSGAGALVSALQPGPRLVTLTDWLNVSADARRQALEPCLQHLRAADPAIQAWVQVLPQRPTGDGPLSEIPFGVKDIIETRGLATEYGSPIYKGRIGTDDAAIVRELRRRGGVLVGKTHTTSFAYRTPAPTRNPHNPQHTPGGSSSGSAAAVAAGMVPLALGTQTGGSVLRPASYCGVTGFKPTYGLLPTAGVLPLAPSLDTLGFFVHTPADMIALWTSMGHAAGNAEDVVFGVPDPLPAVDPVMAAAFQRALTRLRAAGLTIRPVDMGDMLGRLVEANLTIMAYEGARVHQERFRQYGERLEHMADLVRQGLAIPEARMTDVRRYVTECRQKVAELHKATPIIVLPAATGPAPRGLESTGDAAMNRPWTTLGTPAISIPMPVADGLPLGLQLTADRGQDARLLAVAARVHRLLRA